MGLVGFEMGSQKQITNCNINPVGDKGSTHNGTLVTTIQKWIMSGASNCSQILAILQNCLRAGAGTNETRNYPDEYNKFHPNVICFICLSWVQYFTWFFLIVSKSLNWISTKWRWVGHLLYGPKTSDTFFYYFCKPIFLFFLFVCSCSFSSFSSPSFHFFSIIINIHSVLNSTGGKSELRKAVVSSGANRDLNSLPRN